MQVFTHTIGFLQNSCTKSELYAYSFLAKTELSQGGKTSSTITYYFFLPWEKRILGKWLHKELQILWYSSMTSETLYYTDDFYKGIETKYSFSFLLLQIFCESWHGPNLLDNLYVSSRSNRKNAVLLLKTLRYTWRRVCSRMFMKLVELGKNVM